MLGLKFLSSTLELAANLFPSRLAFSTESTIDLLRSIKDGIEEGLKFLFIDPIRDQKYLLPLVELRIWLLIFWLNKYLSLGITELQWLLL